MIASAPADIEQAYKAEKAKVDQTLKDKKAKINKTLKEKRAQFKEARQKRLEAAKAKAAKTPTVEKKAKIPKAVKAPKKAALDKTAKTSSVDKITKETKFDKKSKAAKDVTKEETPVVKVVQRAPDIKTLETKTVIQGEPFMIKRPASPNFGRTWKLHKELPIQIEMVGKEKFVPAEHPGRNEGTTVFTFKGLKAGKTQLEFEKVYPKEIRDKKPAKIRIIPIEIKETDTKK